MELLGGSRLETVHFQLDCQTGRAPGSMFRVFVCGVLLPGVLSLLHVQLLYEMFAVLTTHASLCLSQGLVPPAL